MFNPAVILKGICTEHSKWNEGKGAPAGTELAALAPPMGPDITGILSKPSFDFEGPSAKTTVSNKKNKTLTPDSECPLVRVTAQQRRPRFS